LKVTLLGTGTSQGVPVIACDCQVCLSNDKRDKRLRTSALIEIQGKTFVIDTGPDFRYQMLRENIQSLDAVILTHQHKDHIAGLDDVRAFNFKQKSEICVYADAHTLNQVHSEFYYAFEELKYPGVPQIKTVEINENPFLLQGIPVQPVRVLHHKMPVLGYRIGNFAYLTDVKTIPDYSLGFLQGLEVLVLNALRIQPHISHLNLKEALEMVDILKPEKTYFTHISHLLGKHAEIEAGLPSGVALGYDRLQIELSDQTG